jgi:hypothetical protein
MMATIDDFQRLEMRAGEIVEVTDPEPAAEPGSQIT